MKKIFYLGFYADPQLTPNRYHVLSAVNKMNYIISVLQKQGRQVEVVSDSMSFVKAPASTTELPGGAVLKLFAGLGTKNIFARLLSMAMQNLQFFFYVLTHCGREDTLVVYHSLVYAGAIRLLQRIKGFRLILEVEEIYADVTGKRRAREKEFRFFACADAYIFPTQLLDETINTAHKPSAIIHGTYQAEPERAFCKFDDEEIRGKKHVVYAGTFDPRKGGAIAAAAAAEHLPSDYHIHILGFGSKAAKKNLQETVEKAAKAGGASVTMDGLLSGEAYTRFLQSCQIGLSTQNPTAAFNDTSFPSKILSYMANGLHVVSIRIPAVERSAVGEFMHYYEEQTPEQVARAIQAVDLNGDYDGRAVIRRLDEAFQKDLVRLLKEVEGA